MNHWTDSKINAHGLYCTITLLLRALMARRLQAAKLDLSIKRLLSELGQRPSQEAPTEEATKAGGAQ